MPLLARTVATPVAIEVSPGAVGALAPLLSDGRISLRGKVAIAVGPGHGEHIASRVRDALPDASILRVQGGSLDAALGLIASLRNEYHDALVGIGGGRTLDAAKYAASMVGLPFVSVPTTLTHDGIASPVASLDAHGRKASFGVHVPIAVFVDIDEVRKAPDEHTRSGVGDVLSNLSAIADWQLAGRELGEPIDGLAVSLARSAAEALVDGTPDGDAFLITLAESLIMSGLAMAVAGSSRPCSGACHEISHAMDAFLANPALHGLQVALGARVAMFLRGDEAAFDRFDRALERYGLPRTPKDLGLTLDDLNRAVVEAPLTRPDRFTVLEHLDLSPAAVREVMDAFVATVDR